jgi:hypothetical protein
MIVLIYQIGIIAIICISALFGKKARNIILICLITFTLVQVFTTWLIILQLITIFIAYSISKSLIKSEKEKPSTKHIIKTNDKNGGRIYNEYDENDDLPSDIREKIKSKKEIQRLSKEMYDNDPEVKKATDDVIKNMFKK